MKLSTQTTLQGAYAAAAAQQTNGSTNKFAVLLRCLFVLMLFVSAGANAQVSVTATAGTLGPTSYGTLKLAFDAINAGTHQGAIAIGISANTTEGTTPATLNSSGAGSASYTSVSIRPTNDGVSVSGNPATGFGVIQLNGADNVTIDGDNAGTSGTNRNLTVNNTATATVIANSVIRIATSAAVISADNNTIKNCILNDNVTAGNSSSITSASGSSNSSFGIYCGGNGGATATGAPTAIASVTSNVAPTGTTINTLLIDNNAINQCARGIVFNGNAAAQSTGVTITNNVLGTAASLGAYPFATPTTTVYTKGIWINGTTAVTITGNTLNNILSYISTTMTGIELVGALGAGTTNVSNNIITAVTNNGTANGSVGILVSAVGGAYTVSGNTISTIQDNTSVSQAGIRISTAGGIGTISKNTISAVYARSTGGYGAFGIDFSTAANGCIIQNNMIYDLNAVDNNTATSTIGPIGIHITSGTGHKIYHNSVNLSGAALAGGTAAEPSACLMITNTATGADIRNNLFQNTRTGSFAGSVNCAISLLSGMTVAANYTINNNAYYVPTGTNFYLASTNSTSTTYTTANFNPALTTPSTNWRSYTSTLSAAGTNDNASFGSIAAAPFLSNTNLHLDPASGQVVNVEQKGATGTGVTTDIDGDTRPNGVTTNPDMGADEIAVAVCSSAVGGTITPGTVSKCVGQTYAMSSAGATVGSGITYQWEISATGGGVGFGDVSGGSGATTTSYTTAALTAGVYYYRLRVTCSAGPVIGYSNELTLTVNTLPTVAVAPTAATICQPGASAVTLTASGAVTYSWNPTTGLTPTSGSPVAALPTSTTAYIVTGTDANGCTNTATSTITVSTTPNVAATATPANICSGANSQLLATANVPFTTSLVSLYTMNGSSATYVPITGTTLGANAIGDDVGIGNLSIGFSFNYNGSAHTIFGARSNGLIELDQASTSALSGFSSNALASTANCIAPLWDDNNTTGGSIIYATTGAVGFRVLTVQWTGMHVGNTGGSGQPTIDMQVKLYEGTNKIEFIYGSTSAAFTSTTASIGLSGASGNYVSVTPAAIPSSSTTSNSSENSSISSAANFPSGTKYTFTSAGAPVITYLWSPTTFLPGGSETTANPLATAVTGTTPYTVTASSGGCSAQASATVTVSPLTAGSITTTGSFCVGSGLTATANTTGGSPTYNYAWTDDVSTVYPNTQTVNINLAAGAHTLNVTVTDACGGNVPMTLPVTINPLPAVAVVSGGGTFCTSATITAANGNDGTMYFQGTTSGGTSTATPSASQVVSASGTYYFRAQSAQGCWGPEGSAVVTIQTPASVTTTPASICQGGTGSIAASSGTGCVSFVNSGTAIPGTWVAATDPIAKRITSSISNTATCSFDATITRNYVAKQFQVSVTGAYVFEMDNNSGYDGMGYIVSGAFTPGSCATGTWIRGDDDNGSGSSEPKLGGIGVGDGAMTLTAGVTYTLVSTTYSLSTGTFSGSFNWTVTPPAGGQVMLPVTGTIQWYTAATGGASIGSGSPFNPVGVAGSGLGNTLTAGTTVFYAACSNSSSCRTPVNFVINPNSTITLTSGPGSNNQSACFNTATPINNVTYSIGGGGTGAGATGLPPGVTGLYNAGVFTISGTATASGTYNYTVTTTGGGCTQAQATGSIIVNAPPTATYTATNVSICGGTNDGTITVNVLGGTGPYTYSWTGITGSGNPATTPFPNPGNVSSLTGLPIGYYNVTATDAVGCPVTITGIHIGYAFSVYITNSGSNSSSCGNTGTIILYGNAGVQPYSYALDGGSYQPGNTFTGIAAGSHTGYIKDAAGCISTKSITVNAAAAIVVSPFVRAASSCAPDGSIEVYKTGGIPPFTYSKDGVNYQASNVFSGLAAGPYTVYAKDGSGCVGQANVTVAAGVGLSATISKVNTSTCLNDGSIQVNPGGGVAPYTYSKDNGTTYQAGNSFGGLGQGNYAIKVKDFKGCTSGTINVTINLNTIVVTSSVTNASSCASSNGSIQLFRTGGVGPYTYSLDGNVYQASGSFTGKAAGTYDGYVQDSKGCIGVQSGIVVGPACPRPIVTTRSANDDNEKAIAVTNELKVQAYPNPTANEFTLRLEGFSNEKLNIIVTDIMGRKVYQAEGSGNKLYHFGNSFMAGIYNVQVVQGDRKQTIKVIKE